MIKNTQIEKAYAKINLYLDVTRKRDDGYHDIISVMQNISLFDVVKIDVSASAERKIKVLCNDPDIPLGRENIAYIAAEKLLDAIDDHKHEVTITIEKNIPSAAGMAGGSADAAAVLRGLNKLLGDQLLLENLCAIGAKIGADVPFCVVEGTYITRGIGDVMERCEGLKNDIILVVARGGEGVSTPRAYKALDIAHDNFKNSEKDERDLHDMLAAIKEKNMNAAYSKMYNIFEEVILPEHSVASSIKKAMYDAGAPFAMMSGSGPAVFGIFESEKDAKKAQMEIAALGTKAYICNPV